jgi:hypothetical protein
MDRGVEIKESWRIFHSKNCHNLYFRRNNYRAIKWKEMLYAATCKSSVYAGDKKCIQIYSRKHWIEDSTSET